MKIYKDNAKNRKLNRVGKTYGVKLFQGLMVPAGMDYSNPIVSEEESYCCSKFVPSESCKVIGCYGTYCGDCICDLSNIKVLKEYLKTKNK